MSGVARAVRTEDRVANAAIGASNDARDIRAELLPIAAKYPRELISGQVQDVARIAFNIRLIIDRLGRDVAVCDVGGGIGLFSVGCATLGMRATLVDDFRDDVNVEFSRVPEQLHKSYGVQVVSADVIDSPPEFPQGSFDVVTSFDSMEHWHHSPKALFRRTLKWLRPNGLFILGVPNCVNLRKRITVPLGMGKWSRMEDWYEQPRFRQHVREPDTGDLRYIARDLGLLDVEILGRNWLGYASRHSWVRAATPFFDVPLRLIPSLCSDLYLIGRTDG